MSLFRKSVSPTSKIRVPRKICFIAVQLKIYNFPKKNIHFRMWKSILTLTTIGLYLSAFSNTSHCSWFKRNWFCSLQVLMSFQVDMLIILVQPKVGFMLIWLVIKSKFFFSSFICEAVAKLGWVGGLGHIIVRNSRDFITVQLSGLKYILTDRFHSITFSISFQLF